MLHTTCYDRLQSRRSCSCDKDISLLQMHDIRLFGMPSFLYHYQQIYHVLSSDFWYFTPSTCWKKVLILPKPARCGLSLPLLLLISFLQFTFFLFIAAAMQYFLFLIETPLAVLNQADGKQHCVLLRTYCCPQVYHKKKISWCCCKKHRSKVL